MNEVAKKTHYDNLLDGLSLNGRYSYLKIILSKNENREPQQKYLMVTTDGFGIVRLLDVDFDDYDIILQMQDIESGIIKHVRIDINDDKFHFLLVSWLDVQDMVRKDSKLNFT